MEITPEMEMSEQQQPSDIQVKVKTPKRVLHFSDGTLEEFSDDDTEESQDGNRSQTVIDPKSLSWGPWTTYMLWAAGTNTLAGCDYIGEWLASAFGITTPKYYFEIEEYKRREAEKKRLEVENHGWCDSPRGDDESNLITKELRTTPTTVAASDSCNHDAA